MKEIWAIFMGGIINSDVIFRKWPNFEGGINKGAILNEIYHKKFLKQKFRRGRELIDPISFLENRLISRGGIKKGFMILYFSIQIFFSFIKVAILKLSGTGFIMVLLILLLFFDFYVKLKLRHMALLSLSQVPKIFR